MKFVIAPQNFKGSASAIEVARSMSKAVRQVFPHAQIVSLPLADGGTGTVETLVEATGGRIFTAATSDPLGRAVTGQWGVLGDGETAIVEVASASGLSRLGPAERNPPPHSGYELREEAQDGRGRNLRGSGRSDWPGVFFYGLSH